LFPTHLEMVSSDTKILITMLQQISQQLMELERRLSEVERPKLVLDDYEMSSDESESSDGYESAPATFQY